MSNVLAFPKQSSVLSKAAPEMVQWFKDNGAPDILADLFLKFSDDRVKSILPDNILNNVEYGWTRNDDSGTQAMFLETQFRPKLVPEFGTQSYRDFLRITINAMPEGLTSSAFPTDEYNLMQSLCNYADSYPELSNSNLIAFCYALVEAVLLDDRFRYVEIDCDEHEILSSTVTFGLTDDSHASLWLFCIDILPILLDNVAIRFWEEKLGGKD